MEKARMLECQMKENNLKLDEIKKQQKKLITEYVKEKGKVFFTELSKDSNGNYILPKNVNNINELECDLGYVNVGAEITNTKGEDIIGLINVLGFEYNKKYNEINVFYCDDHSNTEILYGDFDYIFDAFYNNIINLIIKHNS